MSREVSQEAQLESFLDKFTPAVAAEAREILAAMQRKFPGAMRLVYDNYNALAIGFGTGEKVADAIFSIAVFPRWVSLFFLNGVQLHDPEKLLKGSGNQVRHIVLDGPGTLRQPGVKALMAQALDLAAKPMPKTGGKLVIKSIAAKQRPRRPAERTK